MSFWEKFFTACRNSARIFPIIKQIPSSTWIYRGIKKFALRGKEIPYPDETVMDRKWDNLIILDACRHDLFVEQIGKKCDYIISVGTHTSEWFKRTFQEGDYNDIIYISANPYVSEYYLKKWLKRVPFFHLEEVWNYGWDEKLKTVPPQVVVKAAIRLHKKYPRKRLIIHFMQPHQPFIGEKKLIYDGWEDARMEVLGKSVKNPRLVWDALKFGEISRNEFWEAYKSNLKLVLDEVEKLKKNLNGKIVVTSDHGNCLGEYGLYAHPEGIRVEELVKVPWHEDSELTEKIEKSKGIIKKALEISKEDCAVAFTGGKDSTVLLHLIRDVCNGEVPIKVLFIEESHFPEVYKFVEQIKESWNLDIRKFSDKESLGEYHQTKDIDRKKELARVLKINALKDAIKSLGIKYLFVGIRWDEHPARAKEEYFSERKDPEHTRVHPILHFTEKDIWDYIRSFNVPYCKLYDMGYRSLGEKEFTQPVFSEDADERSGREKEKEMIMDRLRDLGYF